MGPSRFVCPLIVVALSVLVAACGEDRETGTGTSTGGGNTSTSPTEQSKARGRVVATVRITETDFKLKPSKPQVSEPGVVEFVAENKGKAPHALEVEGPSGEAETETMKPGGRDSFKVNLSKPGTYTMYCPVGNHEERGMKGKVTVAGGGSGGAETETKEDSGGGY